MKLTVVFQEFEQIAEELNIRILQEKGNFNGGYCLLEEQRIIVINKVKPLEQRIRALAQAFSKFDTSQIYLKPAIREMIESEDHFL
mgnify:FL=1